MVQADPQNILVIHFGQLGDVILGLPALNAIRQRFASAKITVMSGRSAEAAVSAQNAETEAHERLRRR